MAAPTPIPIKAASLIGVSTILLSPNLFHRPGVTLYARPVVLSDLLANEDHVRIAFDFLGKRLVKGFAIFDEGHKSVNADCSMGRQMGKTRYSVVKEKSPRATGFGLAVDFEVNILENTGLRWRRAFLSKAVPPRRPQFSPPRRWLRIVLRSRAFLQ